MTDHLLVLRPSRLIRFCLQVMAIGFLALGLLAWFYPWTHPSLHLIELGVAGVAGWALWSLSRAQIALATAQGVAWTGFHHLILLPGQGQIEVSALGTSPILYGARADRPMSLTLFDVEDVNLLRFWLARDKNPTKD